jgi:hypothetical protein
LFFAALSAARLSPPRRARRAMGRTPHISPVAAAGSDAHSDQHLSRLRPHAGLHAVVVGPCYERDPANPEHMIRWAAIDTIIRRLL